MAAPWRPGPTVRQLTWHDSRHEAVDGEAGSCVRQWHCSRAPRRVNRRPAGLGRHRTLPLVCWPNLEHAFSVPKIALLLCVDILLAVDYWTRRNRSGGVAWPVLAWTAAVAVSALLSPQASLEGLLVALAPAPLFWAGSGECLPPNVLAGAVGAGSAVASVVAVLQYAGADPLAWLGWRAGAFSSARMRVYGTLGNPDFVAAWCCAALPLSYFGLVERARGKRAAALGWAAVALQCAAIFATRSRAALLALAFEAMALAVCRRRAWNRWMALLAAAAVLALLPGARPLGETIRGRLYLARVSLSQPHKIPFAGCGPGCFETQYARWQVEWLRTHASSDARFAGPVDHAHNDYLEFLVEYGVPGLCVLIVLCWRMAAGAWRLRLSPDASSRGCGGIDSRSARARLRRFSASPARGVGAILALRGCADSW